MTKYRLEEFKAWLEENPERGEGLDWTYNLQDRFRHGNGQFFATFTEGTNYGEYEFANPNW
jgi:hypothetical protein